MNSFRRAIALGGVVLACISSACGAASTTSSTASSRKVQVMLDWTPNTNHAGMYLANANGWYREVGLEVTFLQPGGGADVAQAVGGNSVDFGISTAEQLVPAREAGVPVVSIAAIIEHNTSSLISLAEDGIVRPRDMEGKTYGGFGGGFEQALVEALVSCDGGDPSKVEFANVGEADYRDGLTRNQYDVVWVFDGWDVIRMEKLDNMTLERIAFIDQVECIPDWYTPIIITSETNIADDPELVEAFMRATSRGYQAAMDDPDSAAAAMVDAVPELDPELVGPSAGYLSTHYATTPTSWGRQDERVWARFVAFLVENGLVKDGFDVEAAFTNAYLPTAP